MNYKSFVVLSNLIQSLAGAGLLAGLGIEATGCAAPPPAHYTFIVGLNPAPGFYFLPPAPPSSALLLLPQSGAAPAPWLEPPVSGVLKSHPLGTSKDIAYGQSLGIVQTQIGYFAVDTQSGIVGPLFVPEKTRHMLVAGEKDALFAITEEGALYRAEHSKAAGKPGGFIAQGQVPGAILWDASGTSIVAAKGSEVFISSDEGKSFRSSTPAPGKNIHRIFVRYDGIVAVMVEAKAGPKGNKAAPPERTTYLSRNEGKSWQPSLFQPLKLERHGSMIWNGHSECPAVLSQDGRQWTKAGLDIKNVIERESYANALFHSDFFIASETPKYFSAQSPPPPPIPKPEQAAKGIEKACAKEAKEVGGAGGFGLLGTLAGMSSEHCRGAYCLIGTLGEKLPSTRTQIEFFSNGTCEEASVAPDGMCRAGARLAQPPTMAIIDRVAGSVFSAPLPEACDNPHGIINIGGIGIVLCWAGADFTRIFTADARGQFAAEGILPIAPHSLSISMIYHDGTIVLQQNPLDEMWEQPNINRSPPQPLRGFARAPRPLGDASAWREVRVPNGLAMRPFENGQVLIAAGQPTQQGSRLSLYLDRIGLAPLPLLTNMEVLQNLLDINISGQYLRIQSHPTLNQHGLWKLPPKEKENQKPAWHALTQDGRLIPESH